LFPFLPSFIHKIVNFIPAAFICKHIQRFPISHSLVEISNKRRWLLYNFDFRLVSWVSNDHPGHSFRRLVELFEGIKDV
jgi:hypothetical protein